MQRETQMCSSLCPVTPRTTSDVLEPRMCLPVSSRVSHASSPLRSASCFFSRFLHRLLHAPLCVRNRSSQPWKFCDRRAATMKCLSAHQRLDCFHPSSSIISSNNKTERDGSNKISASCNLKAKETNDVLEESVLFQIKCATSNFTCSSKALLKSSFSACSPAVFLLPTHS